MSSAKALYLLGRLKVIHNLFPLSSDRTFVDESGCCEKAASIFYLLVEVIFYCGIKINGMGHIHNDVLVGIIVDKIKRHG